MAKKKVDKPRHPRGKDTSAATPDAGPEIPSPPAPARPTPGQPTGKATAKAADKPPPQVEPTDYYLRIEGQNIGAAMGDTDQLSVTHGTSLLLRQAILDIAEPKTHGGKPLLPDGAKPISFGASVGEFRLTNCNRTLAAGTVAHIGDYLNKGEYRHLSFGVVAVPYQPGVAPYALRERALAQLRFGQLRAPTCVPPAPNTLGSVEPCGWDGRRPADSGKPIPRDGKDIHVSTSVRERYDYGLKQKQAFYAREAQLGADHPAWGLNYTNDIDELSSDEGAANLDAKIAVIYADGNRFSKIREKTCKDFKDLKKLDEKIRERRCGFLSDLLRHMAADPRCRTRDGRIRLETLLWGGDELRLIVPAWRGFAALQFLFNAFAGWEHDGWRLSHAAGIVFCHAKTPIQRATATAEQLANGVKARLKAEAKDAEGVRAKAKPKVKAKPDDDAALRHRCQDRFDYLVLESIDFPTENDLAAFFRSRYGHRCADRAQLSPTAAWGGLELSPAGLEAKVVRRLADFPKAQAYALAQAAVDAQGQPDLAAYKTAHGRMVDVVGKSPYADLVDTLGGVFGNPPTIKIGDDEVSNPWFWIHLAELWDYLAPDRGEQP